MIKLLLVSAVLVAPLAASGQSRVELPPRSSVERTLTIAAEPDWSVGGTLEDPDREFEHRNGLLNAAVSGSGAVAAFDGDRIHLFNLKSGTHRIVGRRGGGPGEFRSLSAGCFTRGDTLFAYDFALRRLSVLTSEGIIVRQVGVQTYLPMWTASCSNDGTIALQESSEGNQGELRGRIVRLNTRGEVVAATGAVGTLVGRLRVRIVGNGPGTLVGDPRTREVREYTASGRLERVLVVGDAAEPMDPSDVDRLGLSPRRGTSSREQGVRAPVQSTWPYFEAVLVDASGRIWIERFRRKGSDNGEWLVVNGNRAHAIVRVPRSLSSAPAPAVIAADADGVVLLRRDPDGAAQISRHRLVDAGSRNP